MPASLNLTPVTAGSLTLEPFAPLGGESYLLQETGDKILLEDNSGFIILEESGTGLTLTPISPGSLTLTPITQGSAQIADKKISQLTSGSPAQSGDLIPIDRSGSTESISVNDIKTFVGGSSSPLTTKGDIWGYGSADARIPIGSNGNVLTVDSAQALGLKWAAPAAAEGNGDESLFTIAASGTAQTLDIANGATQKITLTGNCTFTFTSPASGSAWYMTLLLVQDATGSRTVTWPTITWLGSGIAPTLQTAAGSVDSVVVFTVDGGSTWYGVAQTSASGLKSGTAFPSSPSDGDLFYRTDIGILYEYTLAVTRWLSVDRKYVPFTAGRVLNGTTGTGLYGELPVFEDIYIETWASTAHLQGTNNGSNFYTVTLQKQTVAEAGSTVASFTTASDTASNNVVHKVSVGAILATATNPLLLLSVSSTGTPSSLDLSSILVVRAAG